MKFGERVDRFTVVDRLGEGGLATVYALRHTTLETPHALKILTISNAQIAERMVREGKLQATLDHPHIVRVTDVLQVRGNPALVMEYVDGPPLDRMLEFYRPPLSDAISIFRGVALGLQHAHAQRIIHRDLKPGNVMMDIGKDGSVTPKLMDFGIAKSLGGPKDAKSTRTGAMMGTPSYMPPEQIRDAASVDERADIYALGCILYELLTGEIAFGGHDLADIFTRITQGDYVAPERRVHTLPDEVCELVADMLAVNRDDRPQTVAAVLDRLGPGRSTLLPTAPSALQSATMRRDPLPTLPPPGTEPTPLPAASATPPVPVTQGRATGIVMGSVATLALVGGVFVVVALLVGIGWSLTNVGARRPDPAPRATVAAPSPPPPAPAPQAAPEATAPEPAPEPTVEPEPVRPPPPKPVPPRPRPRPAPLPTPAPAPAPTPVVAPTPAPAAPEPPPPPVYTASYNVVPDPDILRIELVGKAGRFPPGKLPPGDYVAYIDTDVYRGGTSGSTIRINEGFQRLKCLPSFRCTIAR